MLEKFTPEEIAQIRQELKHYKPQSNKSNLCESDIKRLDEAFADYRNKLGVFASSDLKLEIWDICDYVVCNLRIDTKKVGRNKYKRSSYVPHEDREDFRETFRKIVDVILEMKKPIKERFSMMDE